MVLVETYIIVVTVLFLLALFYIAVQGKKGFYWFKQRLPFFSGRGAFVVKFLNSGYVELVYVLKYPEQISWGKKEERIDTIVVPRDTLSTSEATGLKKQFYRDKDTGQPIVFVRENDTTDFDPLQQHTPQKGAKHLSQLLIATANAAYNKAKSQFIKNQINQNMIYAGLLIIGLMSLVTMSMAYLGISSSAELLEALTEMKVLIETTVAQRLV